MYTIKLSIARDNEKCFRQIPSSEVEWKGFRFLINQAVEEADFWVVYSKGNRTTETCLVSPHNTLFITGEPDSVYHYSAAYVRQFAKVVSCQKRLRHPNLVHDHPAQPWHIGKITHSDGSADYSIDYDGLKLLSPQKTRLISVITSNKSFTKGHRKRIEFVRRLKDHFGDGLDVYGRGFNPFEDKLEVIAPYKYHIAIENCSTKDYWTEKLADSYLGGAFPFYYGCTNVSDYFPSKSFGQIDVNDPDSAIEVIERAIAEDWAGQNLDSLKEAKELILDEYNLFNEIVCHLDGMNPLLPKERVTIKSDDCFIDPVKLYVMGAKRLLSKIINKVSGNGRI